MAKKQKSKTRLDKYYYLAKDHGFRSRATFKLIQLNKKYNFFSNANVCVDLCAAPGGWLQAASKFMPISSVKIGIDLDPIKPIPGCTTFVSDITTQDCRNKLEKELKNLKADVFLNDGAPNVGGNWNYDAYTQSELVLHALKLASEFLKPGGTFVTKVFRSSDYSSLIFVMNQLFKKVEATKPLASRQVSAEIFVVCRGFKNADIDSKFLDPKFALKQLDADEDTKASNIKSIKALLETSTNRHRSGYYGDLYKSNELSDFIETMNPYQFFYENTKITIKTDRSKEYMASAKPPKDYENLINDLKVLGKTELKTLLLWREKIRSKSQKLLKQLKNKSIDDKDKDKDKDSSVVANTEEYKKEKFDAIDFELAKLEKARKRKLKSKEKKREQVELKQKISFLKDNSDFFVNESNDFDPSIFKYLKDNNIKLEDVQINNEESEEEEEEAEEEDESFIDDEDYYDKMNSNIENQIKQQQENKDVLDMKRNQKKKKKKQVKSSTNIEEDVSDLDDNEIVNEKDVSESEEEGDNEEGERLKKKANESDSELEEFSDEFSDHYLDEEDNEENNKTDENDKKLSLKENKGVKIKNNEKVKINPAKKDKKNTFNNPLSKIKFLNEDKDKDANESKKVHEEENESSDTDNEDSNKKMLSKKRKNQNNSNNKMKKDIEENDIEYVPRPNEFEDNLDLDEIAEIRAIAKKMLRKKDRIDIIENTYNRYSFKDVDDAPEWFKEDELKHNKKTLPVTKEEIAAEKEYLREINSRTPKKILEAKNRKKKKMLKQMDKLKQKAQVIVNQDDMGEVSKIREIEKLYKKEMIKNQPKKKYVIARANQKVAGKNSKNLKFVDKRLKKDKRSLKRAERRNKGSKQEKMKKINHMKKQKKVVKFRKR